MEAVRLGRISKRYGDRYAVHAAEVGFSTGRVHAVVGENGAGKSTLLKMAAGLVVPDDGMVIIEGSELKPHRASEALRRGVGMVQQHFALVPEFTVLENLVLGAEPTDKLRITLSLAKVRPAAQRAFEQIDAYVPLDTKVAELGVGDRQRVEIARILFRGARTLILDEPTQVLTARESETLFAKLRVLAGAGCAVIVVTHKLDEVIQHADVVTVMRRGQVVETRPIRRAERDREIALLTRAIMGTEPPLPAARIERRVGASVLTVEDIHLGIALQGISLQAAEGEVVGIAGIEGNGQEELVRVLGGLVPPESGRVTIVGGLAVVYGDRNAEGLVPSASLLDNLLLGELGKFARFGLLRARALKLAAERRRDHVGVIPTQLDRPVAELSGGNQQKVVVARALARAESGARLLVLAHPTRGVDLGAARAIHDLIRVAVQERNIAALVISSDLDELRALCHRVLVMNRGRIVANLQPDASDLTFGEYMLVAGRAHAMRQSDRSSGVT